MNKKHRGILLVALGAVMVIAGLGLHFLNEKQDAMAGRSSQTLLRELNYDIYFNENYLMPSESPGVTEDPGESNPKQGQMESDSSSPDGPKKEEESPMPVRTLSGYDLIGVVQIPSLDLELPVLNSWSYSLLSVAPCRYSGSLERGDLILLGHDYKSHFQPLKKAMLGDEVRFTDVNGTVYHYRVAAVEQIHESDPELLTSDHPLIIFTCTRDGEYRIVVRCEEAD